ncbi:MAG: CHAT domain-containing protein [Acidobacteria bacterium]|nr:CHAT domain-containing protein [Acidobacteriota bacterium]
MITSSEGLSVFYKQQGDWDLAMIELRNSEKWALELGDRGRLAEIDWLKARLYQTTNDYQNAITYAKKAIAIALDRNDRELFYLASTTLGECYLALKNYELAYQHLVQAIQILEQMRHRIIGQEYEKQLFFEQKTAAYHAMIELLVSQNKPLEALKFADKTKARTLNETMSQGIIERVSGVPSMLMREEKRINLQIMEIGRLLREESLKSQPSLANINKLTEQIASTRKTYLDLQGNSNVLQSELKDKILSGGSTISPDLKKALSKSPMAIMEYVVREDKVFLFVISKSVHDSDVSIKTYNINITKKELKEKVSDFHDLISKRSVSFRALSRDLYDLLIKPAENDLKSKTVICFVPDEILWNFPFQAAQGSDNRFLLEQYSIYYAPSLNTLNMLSEDIKPKGSQKNLSFLSYANPPVASKDSLIGGNPRRTGVFAPLPETEVEVNRISRLFSKGHHRALVGEKAVESSFKTLASEYKNIHLATHGVLNNQNPMNSYLLFSDVGDEKNDSLLEAREIANLDLDADMVVLSACETARGSIRRGEGVVGMAWAFLSAGARSTVVSQWKVDSTATASLMVDFYGNMFRNKARTRMTRSESLREASLKLMKDNRYRHPFYWAGFIVIGNNN